MLTQCHPSQMYFIDTYSPVANYFKPAPQGIPPICRDKRFSSVVDYDNSEDAKSINNIIIPLFLGLVAQCSKAGTVNVSIGCHVNPVVKREIIAIGDDENDGEEWRVTTVSVPVVTRKGLYDESRGHHRVPHCPDRRRQVLRAWLALYARSPQWLILTERIMVAHHATDDHAHERPHRLNQHLFRPHVRAVVQVGARLSSHQGKLAAWSSQGTCWTLSPASGCEQSLTARSSSHMRSKYHLRFLETCRHGFRTSSGWVDGIEDAAGLQSADQSGCNTHV